LSALILLSYLKNMDEEEEVTTHDTSTAFYHIP
jgi:hypothetical protein